MHFALTYLHLLALSWLVAGAAILALAGFNSVRARFRGPIVPALLVVAAWASFLLAPGTAHAEGIGSLVLGAQGGWIGIAVSGALFLASTFHIADKIAGWVKGASLPVPNIPGHPKLVEGLAALEQAAMHVLQDVVTPDLLITLTTMVQTKSLAQIGEFLASNYGPKILADIQAQAGGLLGTELGLVFGGDAAVIQAATLRLGVAASKTVATQKQIVTLGSGAKLVVPA